MRCVRAWNPAMVSQVATNTTISCCSFTASRNVLHPPKTMGKSGGSTQVSHCRSLRPNTWQLACTNGKLHSSKFSSHPGPRGPTKSGSSAHEGGMKSSPWHWPGKTVGGGGSCDTSGGGGACGVPGIGIGGDGISTSGGGKARQACSSTHDVRVGIGIAFASERIASNMQTSPGAKASPSLSSTVVSKSYVPLRIVDAPLRSTPTTIPLLPDTSKPAAAPPEPEVPSRITLPSRESEN
eukprot:scaffold765_cov345-Prasinococcus_capsulatus_cf.AAC.11